MEPATTTSRRRLLGGMVVGAPMLALAPATSAAALTSADTPNEADIGFLKDMSAHHIQALTMCERVLGRDTGGAVQSAATEVLRNQAFEVGMMRAWLAEWGESTKSPEVVMAWMGMNDGQGMSIAMMPGYATEAELFELATTDGIDRGRMWLELMRAHHVGGVTMADAALNLAATEKVLRLAQTQSQTQTFEIAQYDQLLATTYA